MSSSAGSETNKDRIRSTRPPQIPVRGQPQPGEPFEGHVDVLATPLDQAVGVEQQDVAAPAPARDDLVAAVPGAQRRADRHPDQLH